MSKNTRQKSQASVKARKGVSQKESIKLSKKVSALEKQIITLNKEVSEHRTDIKLIQYLRNLIREYKISGKNEFEIQNLLTQNVSIEELSRIPADVIESMLSMPVTQLEEMSQVDDTDNEVHSHLWHERRQSAIDLDLVPGNVQANTALANAYMKVLVLDAKIKPNALRYQVEKIIDQTGSRAWRPLFSKMVVLMDEVINNDRQQTKLLGARDETIKAQQDETGYYHPIIRKAFAEINDIIDSDLSDGDIVDPILKAMEVGADLERIRMMKTIFRDEILPENRERLGALVDEVNLRVSKRQTQKEDARAVDIIFTWVKKNDFSIIQKNEASRAYKLAETILAKNLLPVAYNRTISDFKVMADGMMKSPAIVVKHNWAQALGNLCEKEDKVISIKLPYPTCLFEFMVHGKCVIVMASEQPDGTVGYLHFVEFEKDRWFECHRTDPELETMMAGLRQQIEAICVALDSEIADTTESHPPEALNKKRLKAGKLPLRSHHVVDLSKRFKAKRSVPSEDGPARSVRLHWRRGHWRHLPAQRIWINWMLVGNIDLGFVDKHYLA